MEYKKKCLENLKQLGVAPRMATAFIILIIVPYLFLASVIFWFYEKNAICVMSVVACVPYSVFRSDRGQLF